MSNFVLSKDIVEKVGIIPEDSAAATINGPFVDRKDCESLLLKGYAGAETGSPTSKTVDFKLQDADTLAGAGSADVTGGALTTITADDADEKLDIDARGVKQFVRMVCVVAFVSGSTPTCPVAGTIIFGNTKKTPNPV